MSLLDAFRGHPIDDMPADNAPDLEEQLEVAHANLGLMQESIADLELAVDDRGWMRSRLEAQQQFSREGLRGIASLCQLMAIKNPLVRRGLILRGYYVWAEGVSVAARATGGDDDNASEQDVNAVVQAFLDDDSNVATFTGAQAREELERALGTAGNVFLALFTNPRTGRVQVRRVLFDEVTDIITDPDDRAQVQFYKRMSRRTVLDVVSGESVTSQVITYHPDVHYRPGIRPRRIGADEVLWDAPIVAVHVNRPEGWKFGLPDAYAAIDWARAYKEFLEDWARLVKALSRFAWRTTTPAQRQAKVRSAIAQANVFQPRVPEGDQVGAHVALTPDTTLEAIPKTGATIDSESGKPLAAMVASALDVPVTMLLGDPGVTGARATADTLDGPTYLMAKARRGIWSQAMRDVFRYVVDQAVKAPAGPLKGTISRDDDGREQIVLAGDTDRTVDVVWPEDEDVSTLEQVQAIVAADTMSVVPPLVIARLVLQALGVDDVDEILEDLVDEQGNFVSPTPVPNAGQAAVDAFRQGRDPAAALNGEPPTPAPPAPPAA